MTKKKLEQDLEQLRLELRTALPDDAEARARLEQHIRDIETKLENPDEDHEDLIDQLNESVIRLEAKYPRTAGVINEIMQTLSNMGI